MTDRRWLLIAVSYLIGVTVGAVGVAVCLWGVPSPSSSVAHWDVECVDTTPTRIPTPEWCRP